MALAASGVAPVILASKSAARAHILTAAGVPFTQAAALVDEAAAREAFQAEGVSVEDAAIALAELKAAFVARQAPGDAVVVGADQILELEGAWLEKPADAEAAKAQLRHLRGKRHRLVSGMVAYKGGARIWQHVDTARLWVRACSDSFLDRYVEEAGPAILGCVGAYQLEGLGSQLMARVEGDHFTILGLPLLPLLQFLRDQGVLLK